MGSSIDEPPGKEPSQQPDGSTKLKNDNAASPTPGEDEKAKPTNARPEREATMKDYLRVFQYATSLDYVLLVAGVLSSIGAGVTLPLMNVVFGQLVGNFNDFASGNGATESFKSEINRQALYIFALFIARFGLNYINRVIFSFFPLRL